ENLLSEGLGFDTHDPLRQEASTATAPQLPRQRLRSIKIACSCMILNQCCINVAQRPSSKSFSTVSTRPGHHRAKRGYSACWRECMSLTISDAKEQTWLTSCRYVWLDFAMAVSTSHC